MTPFSILLFVPAGVVLLHLLRRRRAPLAVPTTLLWRRALGEAEAARPWRRLRRSAALLLQLLTALALLLAVARPTLPGGGATGRPYALLIDRSLSMSATDVAPSRLEWAKAEALRRIDAAGDGDAGMVVAFSDAAEVLQGLTTDKAALRAAVRGVAPTPRGSDASEALALAPAGADVVILSDGRYPPPANPSDARLVVPPAPARPGGASDNVAVARLDVERRAGSLIVTAAVRNDREAPFAARVRLERRGAAGALLGVQRPDGADPVEVPPRGERADVRFTLTDVPETAEGSVRVAVEGAADALPADDAAYLPLGPARKAQIALSRDSDRRLRDFFTTPAMTTICDAVLFTPESPLRDSGDFDLLVFDGVAPPEPMPAANTLTFGALPPGAVGAGTVASPRPRAWDAESPLTRGLPGPDDVHFAEAFAVAAWPPRTRRLLEGDRNAVLIAAVPRGAFTDVVATFPLARGGRWTTDWPLRLSFPLFLRNAVLEFGGVRPGAAGDAVRPGAAVPLRLAGSTCRVRSPSGAVTTLERGARPAFVFTATDEAGVYVAEGSGGGRRRFAVNVFDPVECKLTPAEASGDAASSALPAEGRREAWKAAALLALLALAAEWWLVHRRG